jgi:transposase
MIGVLTQPNGRVWRCPTIMRAFDPEVVDTVFAAVHPLLRTRAETHPLGCHRPRAADRDCFEVMLTRLVTGCSWEDAEQLCGRRVSDTTVRARRDEWIDAGVFDALVTEAIEAYDKIIGLDMSDVALDASMQKSPAGGEGTGKNPTDRAKLGWKWSVLADRNGVPLSWAIAGAHRNDSALLEPTLAPASIAGYLDDVGTLWLDRGYDSQATRTRLLSFGLLDAEVASKRKRRALGRQRNVPMGLRWPVERTNSWLSNFGQLWRNTDRKMVHRLAQFALAVTLLLVAKLIDWRNRWSPGCVPIR